MVVKLLSHVQPFNYPLCNLPGSSVHGIFQARILEWVAISFSRGSSQHRNRAQTSCIADRLFTDWATREASISVSGVIYFSPIFPTATYYKMFKRKVNRLAWNQSFLVSISMSKHHAIWKFLPHIRAFQVPQLYRIHLSIQEMQVWSLDQKEPL